MRLHLWTAAEVEEHLSGEAEILRGTYFGEFILTPHRLADLHTEAVAPIRRRWHPEVHQPIDAERMLRQMLGEEGAWTTLLELSDRLLKDAEAVDADLSGLDGSIVVSTSAMAEQARAMAATLKEQHTLLLRGDIELLRQQLASRTMFPAHEFAVLPRQLRSRRHHAALTVTNALADARSAERLLRQLDVRLGTQLIAVLAEAGCGKTELAAQLTTPVDGRPAGILLHGRELHAGQTLNDFARQVVIQGTPASSMETLVAAIDAAGQRAGRRLPIVIDGLNEAEDPRDWKSRLASMQGLLRRYPYVLVVCTLRNAFRDEAIPSEMECLTIPGFEHDTLEAIRRYFDYYKINAEDAEFEWRLLSHPLTLRFFCEVTNPERKRVVGVEAMPGSLTALFDRYLEQAAERIAELSPRTHRYYLADVRSALDEIGGALWEQKARSLDQSTLRRRLGDEQRPWNESLVRALEHEGILLRVPGENHRGAHVAVTHDMLAGHLVAEALLIKYSAAGLGEWLQEPANKNLFTGPWAEQHPLAQDIFHALIGLVPRRHRGQQFWLLLSEPLRTRALRSAADLEGAYLDAKTVDELAIMAAQPPEGVRDIFDRLWHTRSSIHHPLNTEFLDTVLRPMSLVQRDLRWTEWIRRHQDELLSDTNRLERRWRSRMERISADRLRARWVMWMQTSTVQKLRDYATRALYWYGRGDSLGLLELALDSLSINDPYVWERMLAAIYGVAMARQHPIRDPDFVQNVLPVYGRRLYEAMFAPASLYGTSHILARDYAKRTLDIALRHHPSLLTADERDHITPPYSLGGIRTWDECPDCDEDPLGFDFRNYTLGRLVPDRSPYDDEHPGYETVKNNILWRISQLGYTCEAFDNIDQQIAQTDRSGRMADGSKTERYGKKYAWIAFFELAGYRKDIGLLEENGEARVSVVDIDPSFPDEAEEGNINEPDLLGDRNLSLEEWLEQTYVPPLSPYLVAAEINNISGPWILLHGFVRQEENAINRKVFAFIKGFFCKTSDVDSVVKALKQGVVDGPSFNPPSDYYTYAGEIPWCDTYPYNDIEEIEVVLSTRHVKQRKKRPCLCRDGNPASAEEEDDFYKSLLDDVQFTGTPAQPQVIIKREDETRTWEEILEALLTERGLTMEMRPITETVTKTKTKVCQIWNAVRENSWESYHTATTLGRNIIVPARQVTDHLTLWGGPQTFHLFDGECAPASLFIQKGKPYRTGYTLSYLRKDLLDRYLSETGMSLIWSVHGERKYAAKHHEDIHVYARANKTYEHFQEVIAYSFEKPPTLPG
jgi:hypothetical protein